jgi:hypothetical protein
VQIVLKSGSLNLLEILGPVKACNGIVLPFAYINYITSNVMLMLKDELVLVICFKEVLGGTGGK